MSAPDKLAPLFSRASDEWRTPPDLFARLDQEFRFQLDAAANATNTLCERWLGPGSPECGDALNTVWSPGQGAVWCNPPYSMAAEFVDHASLQRDLAVTTVMLLPARTDTIWFHSLIWHTRRQRPRRGVEVRLLKGRLRFLDEAGQRQSSAPFPSMVVVFDGEDL